MNLAQELARSLGADAPIKETHVSWVIIAGDAAFKLKKPVRFAFVDQSTRSSAVSCARKRCA